MTCKKCSYILYGSENFCPHCGESCRVEETPPAQPPASEPKPIFISRETSHEDIMTKGRIFQPEDTFEETHIQTKEKTHKKEKGSSRGITVFLSVLCILLFGVAFYTIAERFDIVPAVADFFGQATVSTTAPSDTTEINFASTFGTVSPQINYAPVNCTVSSAASISLRKGPSESYGQISPLPSGCTVQVIGGSAESLSWVYVYVAEKDLYGWLSASYISEELLPQKDK